MAHRRGKVAEGRSKTPQPSGESSSNDRSLDLHGKTPDPARKGGGADEYGEPAERPYASALGPTYPKRAVKRQRAPKAPATSKSDYIPRFTFEDYENEEK